MKFGDYLKQIRQEHNWTQPEAARKALIEQSYLSKLEASKSYPSEEIFDRLIDLYGINVSKLDQIIDSDEFEKLSDIKRMRQLVINQKHKQVLITRGWLLMGLAFLMVSGASLAIAHLYSSAPSEYFYRSHGVLLPEEPLDAFEIAYTTVGMNDPELRSQQAEMTSRLQQSDLVSALYRGDSFVETTAEGRRVYHLIKRVVVAQQSAMKWFLVPGVMFLFGAMGCFYLSYRWQR